MTDPVEEYAQLLFIIIGNTNNKSQRFRLYYLTNCAMLIVVTHTHL